ncbi:mCG145016, partial [Mus musculus]
LLQYILTFWLLSSFGSFCLHMHLACSLSVTCLCTTVLIKLPPVSLYCFLLSSFPFFSCESWAYPILSNLSLIHHFVCHSVRHGFKKCVLLSTD